MIRNFKWLGALASLAVALAFKPALATEDAKVHGLWKLVSYEVEIKSTGEIINPMGKAPPGYVLFMPEGRVFFMFTGEGRKPGKTDKERAELLSTMVAYTGAYRIEGNAWITKVEVAWNPAWVGTEQRREFKIDGKRLRILTPWRVMPNWADKGESRSIVTVERVQQAGK